MGMDESMVANIRACMAVASSISDVSISMG